MSQCRANLESFARPSAPSGLVANGGPVGVLLGWDANANSEQVSSYKVYRSTNRGGPFSLLDTVTTTNYSDETATTATTYWYRVTAVNIGGEGPYSDVSGSFLEDSTAPDDPTILTTDVVGTTAVMLTWNPPTDTDLAGFNVYARVSPDAYALLNTGGLVTVPTYTHTAATAGSTWDYKVTSVDLAGNESTGDTTSIAVPASDTDAPATPATPVALNESGGIRVNWTPNTEVDLDEYAIYRSDDSFASSIGTQPAGSGATYLDATATIGQSYSYRVSALDDSANESAKSAASNAVLRSTSSVGDLSSFVRSGTMVPCVIHARGVPNHTYVSSGSTVAFDEDDDFPALSSGTYLTARYDWDFAAGSNQQPGEYKTLRGFNAAHAYDAAGTYTIRLTRTDEDGKVDVYETDITIAADTRQVVYCSSDGTGDGSSTTKPCNAAKANSILASTANVKILLRCGDTFWFASGGFRLTKANQMVTSTPTWNKGGNVTKPFVGYNAASTSGRNLFYIESGATNAVVENITLDADFTGGELKKCYGIRIFGATNTLVRNVDVKKFGSLVESADVKSLRYVLVQDCRCVGGDKSLKNGIMYIKGDDVVILGCYMPNSRDEHCIRWASACRTLVAFCDLANMQYDAAASPWNQLDSHDIVKTVLDIQQGFFHYVYNNQLTCNMIRPQIAGTIQIGPLNETTGHLPEFVKWVVVERNLITEASLDIQPGSSYLMIRNNVIYKGGGFCFEIDQKGSGTDADGNSYSSRTAHHIYVYNNTCINESISGQLLRMSDEAQTLDVQNNLFIGASLQTGGSSSTQVACARLGSTTTTACVNKNNVYPAFNKFLVGGSNTFESVSNWNQRTNFSGNVVGGVTLNGLWKVPSANQAATLGRPVKGVFEDYYGTTRLYQAPKWVAGAVEGTY